MGKTQSCIRLSGKCEESSDSDSTPSPTQQDFGHLELDYDTLNSGEQTPSADVFEANADEFKAHANFRVNYLRRLSSSQVWTPKARRPPSHKTVIIFDWDDTLLCSTYLRLRTRVPKRVEQHMRKMAAAAQTLLESAMDLGLCFIITNACAGWVEYSCAKYVPELLPTLRKIRVISARARYEPQYPCDVRQWKIQAFLDIQQQLGSRVIGNLISIGDSPWEMEAVRAMGNSFDTACVKTVKLWEQGTPSDLHKQLDHVTKELVRLVGHAGDREICFEQTSRKPEPAANLQTAEGCKEPPGADPVTDAQTALAGG